MVWATLDYADGREQGLVRTEIVRENLGSRNVQYFPEGLRGILVAFRYPRDAYLSA